MYIGNTKQNEKEENRNIQYSIIFIYGTDFIKHSHLDKDAKDGEIKFVLALLPAIIHL